MSSRKTSARVEHAGTYEMLWNCNYCKTNKLLGLTHRFCPNCGAPQDANARYFPPDNEKIAVKDHQYVGADRVCSACENPNAARCEFCTQCGAPLTESAKAKLQLDQPRDGTQSNTAAANKPKNYYRIFAILAGIGVVLSIVGYFLFASKPVEVTLQGHLWSRSIAIETFGPVSHSAWCDQLPGNAFNVSRHREIRDYRQIPDGETCQTMRIDQGDGTYREQRHCVPKYRQEPIYDQRCEYSIHQWHPIRQAKARGTDLSPHWPKVQLRKSGSCVGCEREGAKDEKYSWILQSAKGKEYECPLELARWKAGQPGSTWILPVALSGPYCNALKQR